MLCNSYSIFCYAISEVVSYPLLYDFQASIIVIAILMSRLFIYIFQIFYSVNNGLDEFYDVLLDGSGADVVLGYVLLRVVIVIVDDVGAFEYLIVLSKYPKILFILVMNLFYIIQFVLSYLPLLENISGELSPIIDIV